MNKTKMLDDILSQNKKTSCDSKPIGNPTKEKRVWNLYKIFFIQKARNKVCQIVKYQHPLMDQAKILFVGISSLVSL